MKKAIKILFLCLMLSGCNNKQETYANGVPTYFLEPNGYVIAEIKCENVRTDEGITYGYYGYIKESDYKNYLDGTPPNTLIVLHPYENNKSVTVNINKIISIKTGIYKDKR